MLIVTDVNKVNEIFTIRTPRPIRDVMLEIYPDAVEDINGRFHAPHDGYLCPITEREFRDGTRGQNVAVWQELISQTRAHEAETPQHIGTVGEKIELELTVSHIAVFSSCYGNVYIHIMHDAARNVVIYKGSNKRLAEKGAKIRVLAKIKSHGEREGVKQTVIERPKVLK